MHDELMLIGSSDEDLPTNLNEMDLLKRVQEQIEIATDDGDVDRAMRVCAYFQNSVKLAGKSLSQALYTLLNRWEDFKIGEDFGDYIEARLGIRRHTTERYIKVAQLLLVVPEQFQVAINQKGIQQLVPIAHAVSQGYHITNEIWEDIVRATNYKEVANIINHDVKSAAPRENALTLVINREGSIMAYKGEMEPKFVGSLDLDTYDLTVKQAVDRIINNTGILKS